MAARLVIPAALALLLVACATDTPPPNPDIGFADAAALPASASRDELVENGARVLDAEAVRGVIANMGEAEFAEAIGGSGAEAVTLRSDGVACLDANEGETCRRLVGDGRRYRLFNLEDEPMGTLRGSAG